MKAHADRIYVYATRGDRLRAFYCNPGGELAAQVTFLRIHGYKVYWRKAA